MVRFIIDNVLYSSGCFFKLNFTPNLVVTMQAKYHALITGWLLYYYCEDTTNQKQAR